MSGGRRRMVLNVAEKPSVAKSVSAILSRNRGLRVRDGRSRYNKIFEFECSIGVPVPDPGNPRRPRYEYYSSHMLFTSVIGHLMELEFEDRYRKWHSCDPADLYHAPVRKYVPQDKLDIKRTLEEEARKCECLVLWLDCDREGENIAFEVIEVCISANPHLEIYRAHFSALTDRDILGSAQKLVKPNQLDADAVDARQEIDLRIGASFTRFQTMLLRDAFILDNAQDDRNVVLSYGPCQFPTLGFIVERFWEIQAHEPEEFWTINCSHTSEDGTSTFSWARGHLFDYPCAVILYDMCVEEPTATVIKVSNQERKKYPPFPLSTVELQKRASRYFRMSSEHTMKVAEDLYQTGFISYPRTETDSFSLNMDLQAIVQEQQDHSSWGSYAQRLLDPAEELWSSPGNGGHDDKAHPPIHPTKFSAGESRWSQDHNRLYELVVRHFLACVSKPAIGAETTVEIDIAGESFTATGRVIIAKNYLEVYRFESWGGSTIPNYALGQKFIPTSLTLDSSITRPPPLLSESDLLSCMDKAGIGTDATMHDHIKKLLDRFYASKDNNTRFSPTNLGQALVMGYDTMGYELWKPNLRANMERDMKAISAGTKRKSDFLQTCLEQTKSCFLDARLNKVKLLEAMEIFFERSNRFTESTTSGGEIVRTCNLCLESNMMLKRRPDGHFMVGCSHFPLCRNVVWLPAPIISASVTSQVCTTCIPGPVYKIQFNFRRTEIPPNYDVNHLGCIGGCDDALKELTEICGTGPRIPSSTTARGLQSTDFSASAHRGGATRQTGHSSSDWPSQTRRSQNDRNQTSGSGRAPVVCNSCGTPCILRTSNTTANRGRKFYSCQSQECNFFVWEDNVENNGTGRGASTNRGTATRRGGRGRARREGMSSTSTAGTFVTATGEPVSGGRCYSCGDPSHFANVCPNRGTR
ncbi:DNA topoisomerase 3-alpha [Aristolochia californica]|uniref:DNA topoisomerase 3-alpha n=1 Tax=Aristolochia californica TaxID=171875 RepID=UPI0035E2861A